jgi:hypothetical protein
MTTMAAERPDQGPPPWEPPTAGTEVEHLLGSLERQRATFRWKADGLDSVGLAFRVGASTMTLGGLLLHLAAVEVLCSTWRLDGSPPLGPWDPNTWDTAEGWAATFDVGEHRPEELYGVYDDAVVRSRDRFAAVLDRGGLDQPVALSYPDGHPSLRRLLFDLLEEYARHTGHADLLREAFDGRVGEDPPGDWLPPGA